MSQALKAWTNNRNSSMRIPVATSRGAKATTTAAPHTRGFNVSPATLLNSVGSWSRQNTAMDYDLFRSLLPLRAFSRDLCQNTFVGKRLMQLLDTHVVGPMGFNFSAKPRFANDTLDVAAAKAIKTAWEEFCVLGVCDVTGKLSMDQIDKINVKSLARDGEFLVREIVGVDNGFQYGLQLLDTDRLDLHCNVDRLGNGNQIVMGVEITPYQRPVAFHLLRGHPGATYADYHAERYERVPIDDVYHIFIQERAEQTRGIPWMHAVMGDTKNLAGFVESAIIASRIGASKMGFFTDPEGTGESVSDGVDDDGTLFEEVEPGKFGVLPQGVGFEPFDPDYPNAMVDPFLKSMIRQISAGIGVAYPTLSNDLEGVNFSSIRAGVLEERDQWMNIQGFYIKSFKNPVFSNWLRYALLNERIRLPNGNPLPASSYAKYNRPQFSGRRWQWVDPLKDTNAQATAIQNKMTSFTRYYAEMGLDIRDVWQEIADETAYAKQLGIDISQVGPSKGSTVATATGAADAEDGTDPPPPKTAKGGK